MSSSGVCKGPDKREISCDYRLISSPLPFLCFAAIVRKFCWKKLRRSDNFLQIYLHHIGLNMTIFMVMEVNGLGVIARPDWPLGFVRLSKNKVTHVLACAVGADLSANSSLNYLDNHENFAAEAALLRALVVGKTRLTRNLLIFITAKRCHCCAVKACWFIRKPNCPVL